MPRALSFDQGEEIEFSIHYLGKVKRAGWRNGRLECLPASSELGLGLNECLPP